VYRFLRSPRWIGLGLLMTLAAATMVGLGMWQLARYHYRSDINARIDAAGSRAPVAISEALQAPVRAGTAGPPPTAETAWTRVSVTGRYDTAHEMLARARTVNERVGFEVITPLVLADGTAVLVDRGWIPPADGGAASPPSVPAAPAGEVTVIGRVHAPESRASSPEPFGNTVAVRRIAPDLLAPGLPYPIYGGYVLQDSQDPAFVAIPPDHQNAAMNAGYVVQWWMLAALTLFGYGYLVVREARASTEPEPVPELSVSGSGLQ
jgi:cytochrome oxidase assembly protein ShyY1